jgi:hypothetical protein
MRRLAEPVLLGTGILSDDGVPGLFRAVRESGGAGLGGLHGPAVSALVPKQVL